MPEIDKIPAVLHQPTDPYHWTYDNLPLKNILSRLDLVNSAVDINSSILRDASGNQGTLSNRLSQFVNNDGTIKVSAIDSVNHNIAKHADGSATVSSQTLSDYTDLGYTVSNPVSYVKMLVQERNKLSDLASGSTSFKLKVGNTVYDNYIIKLVDSAAITWAINGSQELSANTTFPLNSAHSHYYELIPVHQNIGSPNYTNYKTTSTSTVFLEGTLRVYVNGIRLNSNTTVLVPPAVDPRNNAWKALSFTPTNTAGTFVLSQAITSADVIRIDFETAFA